MVKPNKRRRQSSSSSDSNTDDSVAYVTEVGENDVQLGRGAPLLKMPGHQRFRQLVAADKDEYMASGKHAVKDQIAERIYNKITHERGGKFLRKIDSDIERRQLGIPRKTDAWIAVEKSVAMNKIKQSLREQQSSTSRVAKSSRDYGVKRKASSITGEESLSQSSSSLPRKRRPLQTGKQQSSSSSLESAQKRRDTSAMVAASPAGAAADFVPGVASLPRPHIESPRDVQFAQSQRPQSLVGQQSSSESEESSDYEFRRKHPSLRKRDKLLLRREQHRRRRATSGGGGGGESSTGGSVASVSSSIREQSSDPSQRQLTSGGKLEQTDEGEVKEEDRKPSAK